MGRCSCLACSEIGRQLTYSNYSFRRDEVLDISGMYSWLLIDFFYDYAEKSGIEKIDYYETGHPVHDGVFIPIPKELFRGLIEKFWRVVYGGLDALRKEFPDNIRFHSAIINDDGSIPVDREYDLRNAGYLEGIIYLLSSEFGKLLDTFDWEQKTLYFESSC